MKLAHGHLETGALSGIILSYRKEEDQFREDTLTIVVMITTMYHNLLMS